MKTQLNTLRVIQFITLFLTWIFFGAFQANASLTGDNSSPVNSSGLSLPSSKPLVDYENELYPWIISRKYAELGWKKDKEVRDTGPYIDQVYYGTHPAVRIYYSPEVIDWLMKGRPTDEKIPDGAMIIKEMFTPPAAIYQELAKAEDISKIYGGYDNLIAGMINNWTVMIKDSKGSEDGWFWASVGAPTDTKTGKKPSLSSIKKSVATQVDTLENRGDESLRWSGFAMPCLRCHASAESELTFSDLNNIEGQEGDALIFKSDDSWRTPEYIASNYPLCLLKNEPFVKRFFYLQQNDITGSNEPVDVGCPKPSTPSESNPMVFSDHDFNDNKAFKIPDQPVAEKNTAFVEQFTQFKDFDVNDNVKQSFTLPPSWLDHVVMPADHPTQYITSDNCVGCHGGLGGSPNRDVMFVPNPNGVTSEGFNISEYAEWRWSPMGVAGRDPIFHAQLESEMAYLERDAKLDASGHLPRQLKKPKNNPDISDKELLKVSKDATQNLCLSCHGAMGQRQLMADAKVDSSLDPNFKVDYFYLKEPLTKEMKQKQIEEGVYDYAKYGALAREGISCMVCHHIDEPDKAKVENWKPSNKNWVPDSISKFDKSLSYNLFHHSTGTYNPGPADKVFGPFDDVTEKPMQHSLGADPVHNAYTSNSQMCGNCHTINLPNIGDVNNEFPVLKAASATSETTKPFSEYSHSIEQATFLEWQNSKFAQKGSFESCQDCHMPNKFVNEQEGIDINPIVTQIASIQDSSYPEASHTISNEDLDVPMRDDYSRHTHVGLNVFLSSMMDQFSSILGLNKNDYMTTAKTGSGLAIESMIQQAQNETATITVANPVLDKTNQTLTTDVTIRNKTGHRLPSGVAFRRAFVEFAVYAEGVEEPIWVSGETNKVGVIIGSDKKPLDSEFFKDGKYQPHHQLITREDQVQIYEELTQNSLGEFTTSFIHRVNHIKDNRLLPDGWLPSEAFAKDGEVLRQFMAATDPGEHTSSDDKDYQNPNWSSSFVGQDSLTYQVKIPDEFINKKLTVKATLYNQSIPPYWLKQRFDAVKDESDPTKNRATRRLYYMASHLQLADTPMEDWKLLLVSDSKEVK